MKLRVIHKGVNMSPAKGEPEQNIPVGTVIEIEGDIVPAWLANKVEPADGEKVFATGQANTPVKSLTKAEQKAAMKERAEYAGVLGVTVDPKWTLDELNAAIIAAENPQT